VEIVRDKESILLLGTSSAIFHFFGKEVVPMADVDEVVLSRNTGHDIEFALRWDYIEGIDPVDLDAQAVMFDESGRVADAAFYNQLSACGGSVTHSGDNRSGHGEGDDENIKVDFDKLSPNIKAIALVVTAYSGGTFECVRTATIEIRDLASGEEPKSLGQVVVGGGGENTALLLCVIYLPLESGSDWHLKKIGGVTDGRHFQECLPAVRQVVDSFLDPEKTHCRLLNADKIFLMHKMDVAQIPAELDQIALGLGWTTKNQDKLDLDASCLFMGDDLNCSEEWTLYFGNKRLPGAVHGGDNQSGHGEGDDERLEFTLSKIPAHINHLALTVNIFSSNRSFSEVVDSYVRLLGHEDRVLAVFNLDDSLSARGVCFGALSRKGPSQWEFKALGGEVRGMRGKDPECVEDVRKLLEASVVTSSPAAENNVETLDTNSLSTHEEEFSDESIGSEIEFSDADPPDSDVDSRTSEPSSPANSSTGPSPAIDDPVGDEPIGDPPDSDVGGRTSESSLPENSSTGPSTAPDDPVGDEPIGDTPDSDTGGRTSDSSLPENSSTGLSTAPDQIVRRRAEAFAKLWDRCRLRSYFREWTFFTFFCRQTKVTRLIALIAQSHRASLAISMNTWGYALTTDETGPTPGTADMKNQVQGQDQSEVSNAAFADFDDSFTSINSAPDETGPTSGTPDINSQVQGQDQRELSDFDDSFTSVNSAPDERDQTGRPTPNVRNQEQRAQNEVSNAASADVDDSFSSFHSTLDETGQSSDMPKPSAFFEDFEEPTPSNDTPGFNPLQESHSPHTNLDQSMVSDDTGFPEFEQGQNIADTDPAFPEFDSNLSQTASQTPGLPLDQEGNEFADDHLADLEGISDDQHTAQQEHATAESVPPVPFKGARTSSVTGGRRRMLTKDFTFTMHRRDMATIPPDWRELTFGLGWTADTGVDLDSSCILIDKEFRSSAEWILYFDNQVLPGAKHLGDNRTGEGAGDDERILVNLSKIPDHIHHLAFTINIYSEDKFFGDIPSCYIRMLGDEDEVLTMLKLEHLGDATSVLASVLSRQQEDRWSFQAVGRPVGGRRGTDRECVLDVQAYFKGLAEAEVNEADSPTAPTLVVANAAVHSPALPPPPDPLAHSVPPQQVEANKMTKDQARVWVADFYQQHNPEKLASLDVLLEKFQGSYESLIESLQAKYRAGNPRTPSHSHTQPPPPPTTEEEGKMTEQEAREFLTEFYRQRNPDKLHTIDKLLSKYRGNYKELVASVKEKYGMSDGAAATSPLSSPSGGLMTKEQAHKWITDFYQVHNPEKLEDPSTIDYILQQYEGQYHVMCDHLKQKYPTQQPENQTPESGIFAQAMSEGSGPNQESASQPRRRSRSRSGTRSRNTSHSATPPNDEGIGVFAKAMNNQAPVQTSMQAPEEEVSQSMKEPREGWRCPQCTLANAPSSHTCEACGSFNPAKNPIQEVWSCLHCTLTNPPIATECQACHAPKSSNQNPRGVFLEAMGAGFPETGSGGISPEDAGSESSFYSDSDEDGASGSRVRDDETSGTRPKSPGAAFTQQMRDLSYRTKIKCSKSCSVS